MVFALPSTDKWTKLRSAKLVTDEALYMICYYLLMDANSRLPVRYPQMFIESGGFIV
jgi:hypothetical protein